MSARPPRLPRGVPTRSQMLAVVSPATGWWKLLAQFRYPVAPGRPGCVAPVPAPRPPRPLEGHCNGARFPEGEANIALCEARSKSSDAERDGGT
eukprot:266801-Chlamydomonas_euryale.AAC.7